MKYSITTQDEGKRLDKFLVENETDTTRSQIQKKIKTGFIFVNSKMPTVHQFLKLNDEVEVLENAQQDQQNFVAPKIIEETDDYLILEKPAGLMVHRANSSHEKTLADWLVEKYPSIADVYDHKSPVGDNRPGIVHRLDKEVSGLIMVVKNQEALDFFKKQFKDREVVKKYQALVYGQIEKEEIEI